jgi:O-antigen ligase
MWLVNAPRWLLVAALAYAPWAYGCTRPWTLDVLNAGLGIASALWLLTCLLRRAWPSVHPVAAVAGLALLAQGWFMVANARFEYDSLQLQFVPLAQPLSGGAGSLHRALSIEMTLRISALLGALGLACDMARHREWRQRLVLTLALTGTSIALLGLLQRLTNATAVFWGPEEMGKTFFATYRNHTNAGAFLNLTWPIVAGFLAVSLFQSAAGWRRVAWAGAVVLCLSAIVVNSSRAAAALGLLLALAWAGWAAWQFLRGRLPSIPPAVAVVSGIILIGLVASVAALAGVDTSLRRWKRFGAEVTDQNPRLLATQVCLDMVPQAGWFGFGPGTFETTFPYFTQRFGNQMRGRWLQAHEDYLQTLIEWGYLGATSWAVLIFGALVYSISRAFRHRTRLSASAQVTHFAILVALVSVLLHALVDFPLQIASIQLYVAVLIGLLWSSRHWLREPRQRQRQRSHRDGSRANARPLRETAPGAPEAATIAP